MRKAECEGPELGEHRMVLRAERATNGERSARGADVAVGASCVRIAPVISRATRDIEEPLSIFRRHESLSEHASARRYKIRIVSESGEVFYWHKRGALHTVEEDVARVFVSHFQPELFGVLPDGSLTPPSPGKTQPIREVSMEPADA